MTPTGYVAATAASKDASVTLAWTAGLLTALLLFVLSLNTPFIKDLEVTYALDTRSALRGNWLLVTTICRKPPLYLWLAAIVSALAGGVSEISMRVPGALAGGLLTTLLIVWTVRSLGQKTALMAWAVLVTMAGFSTNLITVHVDSVMLLCIYAALMWLMPGLQRGEWTPGNIIAAGIALGAGILTKGPVILVLTGLSVAASVIVTRRPWQWLFSGPMIAVCALAFAVPAVWYIPGLLYGGSPFAHVVYQENLGHFLPGGAGGTGEAARPFYYIVAHLAAASLPMILFLPAALMALRQEQDRGKRDFLLYSTMPLWVVLIFFSFASAKREVYVLPALPALAILIGYCLARMTEGRDESASVRFAFKGAMLGVLILAAVSALAGLAGTQVLPLIVSHMHLHPTDRMILGLLGEAARARTLALFAVVAAGTAALMIYGLRVDRALPQATGAIAFAMAAMLFWMAGIRPALARVRTEKYFLARIARLLPAVRTPVLVLKIPDYQAEFYLDRNLPILKDSDRETCADGCYLLVRNRQLLPRFRGRIDVIADVENRFGRNHLALVKLTPDTQPSSP